MINVRAVSRAGARDYTDVMWTKTDSTNPLCENLTEYLFCFVFMWYLSRGSTGRSLIGQQFIFKFRIYIYTSIIFLIRIEVKNTVYITYGIELAL